MKEKIKILLENKVISKEIASYVNGAIDYLIAIGFIYEDIDTFVTHLAMASERVKKNEEIMIFSDDIWNQIKNSKNYEKSLNIYNDLLKISPVEYPLDEERFIIMHLCNLLNRVRNNMNTYPLKSINLQEAKEKQFKLVDEITKEFSGKEYLSYGDLGVVPGINKPEYTQKVEKVLANYFGCEKALLVTGSGTGALRWCLISTFKPGDTILVHTAVIYPTTQVSIDTLGLKIVRANFNDLEDIKRVIKENPGIRGTLIQHARQAIEDCYSMEEVIKTIKQTNDKIAILTDDNYAVMKVDKIGVELGADACGFSCFKLQGPEGIGLLLGKAKIVDEVEKMNYSGGSKVQGWQAMEVLRGMIYAPVMLAIQAEVNDELVNRLNNGDIKEIKNAFLANAQSKVLLVEFEEPIAKKVLLEAEKLGGLPNPVGAESKYEAAPMFYRVSGTFLKQNPNLINTMIRINPNRAGAETIIRILKQSIERSK